MTPQTLIFIGRSGCGKGTQVELLKNLLKEKDPTTEILYLETGDRFRELITENTLTGRKANAISKKGDLQPIFIAVNFWSDFLMKNLRDDQHLFLDGICRRLPETDVFTDAMRFYNRKPIVIYINVSRKWSKERLLDRGRADDDEKGIEKRLDWFDKEVYPSIEYFGKNDHYILLDINGEQTIEEVHKEIVQKLGWLDQSA